MSKTRPEWSQEITKRADDLVALAATSTAIPS